MKKIFLIAILVVTSLAAKAQEYWFQEGFATSGAPSGWIKNSQSSNSLNHGTFSGAYAVKFGLPSSTSTDPDTGLQRALVTQSVSNAGTLKFWLTRNANTVYCDLHVCTIIGSDTTIVKTILDGDIPHKSTGWSEFSCDINSSSSLKILIYATFSAGKTSGAFMLLDDISLTKNSGASAGCQTCTGITKFEVPGQIGASIIDTVAGTINVVVPTGTSLKTLTPTTETKGSSVALLWNKGNDACPHIYSSIARNGSSREYEVLYGFQTVELPEYHFREGCAATLTSGMVTTGGTSTSVNHGLYNGDRSFAFNITEATDRCEGKSITTPVVRTAGVLRFWVRGSSGVTGVSFKVEKMVGSTSTLLADFPQPQGNTWTEYVVVVNDLSPALQLRITTYSCQIGAGTLYFDDLSLTSFVGSNKPSVANVRTTPHYPDAGSSTRVVADITDSDDSVAFAKVLWGKSASRVVNALSMSKISGNTYQSSDIQASEGDSIFYKVAAFDNHYVSDTSSASYFVVRHSYSHIENFSASNLSASAGSGSFANGGITWNYTLAKAATMEGKAATLESNGTLYTSIPNGVSLLRFDYQSAATANIEIQVNNAKVAEVKAGTEATSPDMSVNAGAGSTLKMVNKSAAAISIDNIRWDNFEPLTITEKPLNMQLYPALPDSGTVRLAGSANTAAITTLTLSAYKGGNLYKTVSQNITFENNVGLFDLHIKIPAELSNFDFKYKTNLMSSEELLASNVVAGDIYIISGQSNAVSSGTSTPSDSLNDFFRAFGRMYKDGTYDANAATWGKANSKGSSYNVEHYVGYSGNVLARNILRNHKRPSLILNIAVGGTSIEENLPSESDHYDLGSIYGRGLYRAKKAGVQNHIRAIIWVQGEANQNGTYTSYAGKFATLRSAWKNDYPALQKIYVGQLNTGCGTGTYGSEMREVQRKLQDTYSDVEVMSHVGIPIRYDSCHYTPEGYELLYTRYYNLVARDFYSVQKDLINPPNVQKVFFVNKSSNTIAVKFNQKIALPKAEWGRELKDYFYNESNAQIPLSKVELYAHDSSTIVLYGASSISASKLTYGPDAYVRQAAGSKDTLYVGPWLKNSAGIAALTFDKLAIGRDTLNLNEGGTPVEKSSECSIRSLKIGSNNGVIKNDSIWIKNLPASTNLSSLAPTILISDKATVSPASGVAQDFTSPVSYTVTAEDGITQKTYIIIVNKKSDPTSVEEELYKQLRIYPNPVRDVLRVSLPQDITKLELYSMSGLLLKQESGENISVSNLPNGNYLVKIYTESGATLTQKVTVSK